MGRVLVGKPLPNYTPKQQSEPTPPATPVAVPASSAALPGQWLADVITNECVAVLRDNRTLGLTKSQLYSVVAEVGGIAARYVPAEYRYDPTLKVAFVSELDEYKRGYWQAWNDMRDVLEGRMDKEDLLKKAA